MRFIIRSKILISIFLFSLFLFPLDVFANSYWWERGDEGWFFYKDPLKEEKNEIKEKEKPEKNPEPQAPKTPVLFTEKMKKLGEELLSRAMEKPTIENVRAYMEYNRLMMKLSENFALSWQKVLMMYPELEGPAPVSDSDKDLYFDAVKEREKEILYQLSRKAGLFFFYDGSCPFCERQVYYLKRFLAENPFFVIKPVSLDGTVFFEFPDTAMDNGISQRLGVSRVPSIFLAFPPDRFERVSSGLITTEELKRRLIWYALEIDTSIYSGIIGP